jgi:hypothetical protein
MMLQAPQSGIAVAQHRRRRVRRHAGHSERPLERAGCNRRAVACESEAGRAALSADDPASDHFKMPLVLSVSAADVSAIKPHNDGFGASPASPLSRQSAAQRPFRSAWFCSAPCPRSAPR